MLDSFKILSVPLHSKFRLIKGPETELLTKPPFGISTRRATFVNRVESYLLHYDNLTLTTHPHC